MNIDDMEAGPELDQAVNVFVGTQTEPLDYVRNDMSESDRSIYHGFHYAPSTNLIHAVAQAERCVVESGTDRSGKPWSVKLLEKYYLMWSGYWGWGLWEPSWGEESEPYASAAAPELAICRAIMKFAESKKS